MDVVVADMEVDKEIEEEPDKKLHERITNAHSNEWPIIPAKSGEIESTLNMILTMPIQTPPGVTYKLASTAVSQYTLSQTESTLNVPAIKTIKSTCALHHLPQLQIKTRYG